MVDPIVLSKMKGSALQLDVLCQTRPRRLILMLGGVITLILAFQTFTMPSRITSSPFLTSIITELEQGSLPTYAKPITINKLSLLSNLANSSYPSVVESSEKGMESNSDFTTEEIDEDAEEEDDMEEEIHLEEDGDPDNEIAVDLGDGVTLKKVEDSVGVTIALPDSLEKVGEEGNNYTNVISDVVSGPNRTLVPKNISLGKAAHETVGNNKVSSSICPVKNKWRVTAHPISVSEMNEILIKNHAAYHSMRPRWFSARDKELVAAKVQIERAPSVKSVPQLYAPAFRNISKFKRSYELMERTLKVYVYKEGQKPIFHQPVLRGIYASEGWFMKLMQTNKQYTVKDPRKAHLFYIPFSSRLLQFALYVRNSHSRRNLEQHLIDYVNTIAAKYPFWNRTGGSDHFVAACHDWAPSETRCAMDRAIRALCVADVHQKFRLGKDVSLPQSYVHSAKNPQRDLGGMSANNRSILAFYAGNMHGELRTVLLQCWENKYPDMKIFGPMPKGVSRKMAYIQHMQNSKYCICPRGYEVNSPRVVESIFYECVPVIIADNYVPPFFEVLNWEAFSVIIKEEDVPRLKEILDSISEEKYFLLQEGVRRVQQHFIWHSKPVKYDLFHMTLHSIWYNRVYNARTR